MKVWNCMEMYDRHLIKTKKVVLLCRACLVASVGTTGASQSTIKLVATNLIANGKLPGKNLI